MTTKKRSAKRTTKKKSSKAKKKPSKAMLKDIGEVLKKHKWTGTAMLLSGSETAESTSASSLAAVGLAASPNSLNCIPPEKPHFECRPGPDGKIVCGWVCSSNP